MIMDEATLLQNAISIQYLVPGAKDVIVCGVVIAKQELKILDKDPNKRAQSVMNFTIRDSERYFINAICWLPPSDMAALSAAFSIADVVALVYPQIRKQKIDSSPFVPWTEIKLELYCNEKCLIQKLHGPQISKYKMFFHKPCRDHNDYYTIGQIMTDGELLKGQDLNILAAIQQIGKLSTVTLSDGTLKEKLDILLFDENTSGFHLIIWDVEMISYAQRWNAKEHIIFAVDVRIKYNTYLKYYYAEATKKSIFTMNPDLNEAEELFIAVQHISLEDLNIDLDPFAQLTAKEVNIQELKQHIRNDQYDQMFLINCILSQFDIDNGLDRYVSKQCKICRGRVVDENNNNLYCPNPSCQLGQSDMNETTIVQTFDLQVDISDHTGTMEKVRLSDDVMKKWMNCTVEEFLKYPDDEKTVLKWKYLLERFKFGIQVKKHPKDEKQTTIRIVRQFVQDF